MWRGKTSQLLDNFKLRQRISRRRWRGDAYFVLPRTADRQSGTKVYAANQIDCEISVARSRVKD